MTTIELVSLHRELARVWLMEGPDTVLDLLQDLSREELTHLVMAHVGASLQ